MEHPEDAALCQRLLREGRVAVGDLVSCAEAQRRARAAGAGVPFLWELLLARGVIDRETLEAARAPAASATKPKIICKRRKRKSASGRWRPGWGTRDHDGVVKGDRVGEFVITERIACGSMGAVFEAQCMQTQERVALKILAGARARNDSGATRFLREAQLLCTLRHENLVRGLGFGMDAGRRYLATEYVAAPSLKHRLRKEKRLPESEVVRVGLGVAKALAYLHSKGVIHRDVKPANVLCGERLVRLCDLGLAREVDLPSEATASCDTLGTPRYMAPEQARGPSTAGPQADLYALGVTLFHALAGKAPFPEDSGIVALSRHLFDQVPDVRSSHAGASPRLAALIFRLTRRKPADRPESALEVVRWLEWIAKPVAQAA